jgi:hypothetical protein
VRVMLAELPLLYGVPITGVFWQLCGRSELTYYLATLPGTDTRDP